MDCKLDESAGELSAENVLSSGIDVAAAVKSGKCRTRQQGNVNGTDIVMGDRKPVTLVPEMNNLEKDSSEEDTRLLMANRVESDNLMNCSEGNEDKLTGENPSRSYAMDESDDSDFVEEDVKVCDICGDAGREDLLVLCCRCADGAEHTYCMREMLKEVPEGDWTCEECRDEEEMKNQRQRKVVSVDGNGKTYSGKASGGNSSSHLKSDSRSGNDLDITSKDHSNMKILGKRPKEDAEVSSSFKRRAVESVIGSPKTSGSSIMASLSREMSLRNLDKGKEKFANQSSSSTPVGSNDTESALALGTSPRRSTPRCNISLKANPFSSLNANPEVKLANEDVPLKQKSVREPQLDIKEEIGKSYGKSMSFRSTNSDRYGNGEAKVKILSPKFSHNQDNKGFKHTKSVSIDETKNSNQSKQNTGIGGMDEMCQKCKKVGHLAQCCPVGGHPDVSTSKSLREVSNGNNDLKAAIEAAMLRKPGICRKPRVADHSNHSSQASKNGDVVSEGHFVGPVSKKNVHSGLVKNVVSAVQNSTNSCRPASLDNVETSTSRTGDEGLVVTYDGNTSIRDLPFQLPSPISVIWRTMAIPEHEFTWQGNFEVYKNDKVECCDGVQAHISASASPRVLGVVNKFHKQIILNEVPRLSTWPLQFQEYDVKEDDVALYFFAKDVVSYEKSYKILLESMIKNDLALKGIIEGVELLIFPSTQLPQQSQRWNMSHFLWGVFIGKKTSHSYQVCSFLKQNHLQQDIRPGGPATVSLPENICSLQPVEKNLTSNASLVAQLTASKDQFDVSGVPSAVQVKETDKINVETQGDILGSKLPMP